MCIYTYIYIDMFCFYLLEYYDGMYGKTKVILITLQSLGSVSNFKHMCNMIDSSRFTWKFKVVLHILVIA